jgi:hypothetical protein
MNPFFLVLVKFSLVAKDVTTTLKQLGMGNALIAETEEEAVRLLEELGAGSLLRVAVIQASPANFAASALRAALDRLGTRVVLVDEDESADQSSDYPVLTVPFFTDDLEQIVSNFWPKLP